MAEHLNHQIKVLVEGKGLEVAHPSQEAPDSQEQRDIAINVL